MVEKVLGLFLSPVTSMMQRAEEKNVKKEAITAAIIAVIIALVTVLTTYFGIVKVVNKTYKSLEDYNDNHYIELTKAEFKEAKKEAKEEALEEADLVEGFFKQLVINAVIILGVAGVLFIISRMVKAPKDYIEMLAMTNGAFMIYVLGFLLSAIFSFIYAPIGVIVSGGATIFSIISLGNAFGTSLQVSDIDKLVTVSSLVLTVILAILVFIIVFWLEETIGTSLTSLL